MIIGILMGQEICLILGQVSHNLLYSTKKAPDGYVWSGERTDEKNSLHPGQIIYGQSYGSQWEKHAKLKEKQKWSNEQIHLEKRTKIARDLFHRPRGYGIQGNHQETRVRSWKHQWLLPCPVKLRKIVGVVHPTKIQNKTCVYSGS